MARWIAVGGVVLDLLGTIWLLQGLNILGGSRMTGDPFWAEVGAVLIAVGTVLVVVGVRRSSHTAIH
ncbi:MAG: hypothetical protein QOF51_3405 [Chloroflexota bacterium]|jgi:hypothetical protein|nr:hypothetical protein [Chloroflexota bacterium]